MSSDDADPTSAAGRPARGGIVFAYVVVYVVWGSTYLAIRFAVETLPPLLTAGSRFLAAGLVLYAWRRLVRGDGGRRGRRGGRRR